MRVRTVLAIIAALAGIGTGLALTRKQWEAYGQVRRDTEHERAEMVKSEERRKELAEQEASVSGSIGQEELARKQGYLNKGEVPLGR